MPSIRRQEFVGRVRETFRRRTSRIMRVLSVVLALLMTVGGFGIVVSQSAEGWDNHAPTANANGPYKVEVGNNLDLDGTMSTDPDAGYGDSITSYSWDIKADGTWDFTGIAGYMTVPWSYLQTLPQPGVSIPIVLQVTDSFGASGSAATTLTIYENRPEAVFTATPIYAACDQAVFFDASGSYHTYPGRFIISYQWDFGDYTPLAFGVTATHSFYRYGSFTVTLTVTDNNVPPKTDSATASISVNLGNVPPNANAGGPYVLSAGSNLILNGASSSDPNAGCGDSIVSYDWDIMADGTWDFSGSYPTVPWSYLQTLPQPGVSIPIVLQVHDRFWASGSAATTLTIYENRPEAVFTATPIYAACDQAVFFDASGSYHTYPGRFIISYQWDFGDYTPLAFGVTATHSFYRYGSFTVTLTVTDNNVPPKTDSATASISVNLGNVPPNANAGGPYVLSAGSNLILNGASSSDPNAGCGDSIVSYDWDIMADGTWDFSGSYPTVPWSYLQTLPQPGVSIPIVLQVHDRFWASGSAATTMTIYENRPEAVFTATPIYAACDQAVFFDASGSYHTYPGRFIISYQWDFGDYTPLAFGVTATHSFYRYGSFTVTLTVTDNNVPPKTDSATASISVNLGNVPPNANAGGPYVLSAGSNLILNGASSSDPNAGCGDSIVSYDWDIMADGTWDFSGSYPTVPWSYLQTLPQPGVSIPIVLQVHDRFWASGSAATTLTIYENRPEAVFTATPIYAACDQAVFFDASGSYHTYPGRFII